jgi:hypothetical protein
MPQATLNGNLAFDGGEACTCGIEYGRTIPLALTTTSPGTYTTGDNFSATVTGLDPNTVYVFRAWATNSAGTSYGAYFSFLTGAPEVQCSVATLPATTITEGSAQLNGMVEIDNGYPGDVSFEWGLTPQYGSVTSWLSGYAALTAFLDTISPLAPDTAYHFRARFRNRFGIFYGRDVGFTSLAAEPLAVMIDDASLLSFLEAV